MYFQSYTADDLYTQALFQLKDAPIQEGRGEPTKELLHCQFELTEPRNRLVSLRDINPAFAWVEVLWICAGGNSVRYLEFWNPRMKSFASDDGSGLLWGAYGHRLGCADLWKYENWKVELDEALYRYNPEPHSQNVNQLLNAFEALTDKPHSRQIVLQIWNAEADLPQNGGSERARDIPCNLMSLLLLRNKQLHWTQIMRSNDAVWGFPYNIIQWTFLQEFVSGWLGVEPGGFTLLSNSFHTYKKHWGNIPAILSRDAERKGIGAEHPAGYHIDKYALPFVDWKRSFAAIIPAAWELTRCELGLEPDILNNIFWIDGVHPIFKSLMGMLAAEAQRIKGASPEVCRESAYVFMASDPYWHNALLRWWAAKEKGDII